MNFEQFGIKGLEVKGITIHNTGNELSAKELASYMETSNDNRGCHFFVDDKEVIQVMPLDYSVFHTGKGLDFGNLNTIAIEICKSQCDEQTYKKAQDRAIKLINDLMVNYNLDHTQIYFHNSFNPRTYCPHRILDEYGSLNNFIRKEFTNDKSFSR